MVRRLDHQSRLVLRAISLPSRRLVCCAFVVMARLSSRHMKGVKKLGADGGRLVVIQVVILAASGHVAVRSSPWLTGVSTCKTSLHLFACDRTLVVPPKLQKLQHSPSLLYGSKQHHQDQDCLCPQRPNRFKDQGETSVKTPSGAAEIDLRPLRGRSQPYGNQDHLDPRRRTRAEDHD